MAQGGRRPAKRRSGIMGAIPIRNTDGPERPSVGAKKNKQGSEKSP
jgi:hypothetical protein